MRTLVMAAITGMSFLMACNNGGKVSEQRTGKLVDSNCVDELITLDSGNKMITSYLNSIDYTVNDTDTRSIIIDACQLRTLLNDTANNKTVKQIKISFAHTLSYINAGHGNQKAGYKAGAFTVILTGVDNSGNYFYYPGDYAIDRGSSCPTNCPIGTAGNNLLTTTLIRR